MKLLSKKKILIILSALAVLIMAAVGSTIAFYTSTQEFANTFNVGKPGVAIQEKFNPSDHWVPGEEKEKIVIFRNTGDMDMLLRFRVETTWVDKDEDGNPVEFNEMYGKKVEDVLTLYWNTQSGSDSGDPGSGSGTDSADSKTSDDSKIKDFMKIEQADGTYYYYTKVLKKAGSAGNADVTDEVLKSVKFDKALSNDGHANSNFSETQINLTIQGETVLADPEAAASQWPGMTAVIEEEDPETGQQSVTWTYAGAGLTSPD